MEIQEYIKQSERTLIDRSKRLNLIHSALGVITEVGEIIDVIKRHIFYYKELDIVNIKEEIGDLAWYFAIPFREFKLDVLDSNDNAFFIDTRNDFYWNLTFVIVEFQEQYILEIDNFNDPFKEVNTETIQKSFSFLRTLCKYFEIDLNECLEMNIKKLQTRYPEKFTNELALNRNLEAERKVLEGN